MKTLKESQIQIKHQEISHFFKYTDFLFICNHFSTSTAIKSSHAINFVDPPWFRTIWAFMIFFHLFSVKQEKLIHYIVNRVKRVGKRNAFGYRIIAHNYLYKQDRLGLNHLTQRMKYLEISQCRLDLLIFLEFFGAQNGVCDKTIM